MADTDTMGRAMADTAAGRSEGMSARMRGGEDWGRDSDETASRAVRNHEKREHRAKKRYYREKHSEAKEAFSRIAGEPVETEADAVLALSRVLKSGTYKEAAQLIFAASHFCWACDEMGEDETLRDEASEPGNEER